MSGSTIAILVSEHSIDLDLWKNLEEKHHCHLALFQELKPFVQFCCEDQPDLIAVSLHHPYEKIKLLPLSLRKTLNRPVVCFAELEDPTINIEFSKHPQDQVLDVVLDELSFWEVFSNLLLDPQRSEKNQDSAEEIAANMEQIYILVGEQKGFGKIKLADQNEIIKEQRLRRVTQIRVDQKKKEGLLIDACHLTFKKKILSEPVKSSSDFKTTSSFVSVVEMDNYKGLLSFACNQEKKCSDKLANEVVSSMLSILTDWGLQVVMSEPFLINSPTPEFVKAYSEFSEFVVHHKDKNENEWAASFIKREAVHPNFVYSEDNKMLRMDIKSIPPQTVLPFDGYIYLPKNEKYVRYLKKGSFISLEQVKRHSKDATKSHIYVPTECINEVLKFFIQNTISWELAIESQEQVA